MSKESTCVSVSLAVTENMKAAYLSLIYSADRARNLRITQFTSCAHAIYSSFSAKSAKASSNSHKYYNSQFIIGYLLISRQIDHVYRIYRSHLQLITLKARFDYLRHLMCFNDMLYLIFNKLKHYFGL